MHLGTDVDLQFSPLFRCVCLARSMRSVTVFLFAVSLSDDWCFALFSFSLPPGNGSFNSIPRGLSDSATPTRSTLTAVRVPTLYGRDQPLGVSCGVDGDGPVFYGAGMRSGVFTREGM